MSKESLAEKGLGGPQDRCPHCGSANLSTVQCSGGPHWGRLECGSCHRFIKWLPKPIDPESAAAFLMPFGKHRGKPLAELPSDYLAWLRSACDLRRIAERASVVLAAREGRAEG